MRLLRPLVVLAGLVALWQLVVVVSGAPPYMLPGPPLVLATWVANLGLILPHAAATAAEILMGLMFGVAIGASSALIMGYFRPARRWLMPVLVTSQAVPVFAIAPLLVLWFGYGMGSKVAMATLIIYFPVTASPARCGAGRRRRRRSPGSR